jgi:hypothetical protein
VDGQALAAIEIADKPDGGYDRAEKGNGDEDFYTHGGAPVQNSSSTIAGVPACKMQPGGLPDAAGSGFFETE